MKTLFNPIFPEKKNLLFEDESFCADKNTHFFAFEVYFA